jgi:DNA-binding MarR family transcriptional regulator
VLLREGDLAEMNNKIHSNLWKISDMTNRDEYEKVLDHFLIKLYQKSGEGISYIAREDIADELGITETQANKIVDELSERGYIAKGEIVGSKIRITDYGRDYVRDLELDSQPF